MLRIVFYFFIPHFSFAARLTTIADTFSLEKDNCVISSVKKSHSPDELWVQSLSQFLASHPTGEFSHTTGDRLPLLTATPTVTFLAAQHHRLLASTELDCLMSKTRTRVCK